MKFLKELIKLVETQENLGWFVVNEKDVIADGPFNSKAEADTSKTKWYKDEKHSVKFGVQLGNGDHFESRKPIKEAEKTAPKVAKETAKKVYHRDYVKTKKKPYRKYHPEHKKTLKENIEDQHAHLIDEFDKLSSKLKNHDQFPSFKKQFDAAKKKFSKGYETDNDNLMYGAYDDMEEVVNHLKKLK